jgi:hypothetical protein
VRIVRRAGGATTGKDGEVWQALCRRLRSSNKVLVEVLRCKDRASKVDRGSLEARANKEELNCRKLLLSRRSATRTEPGSPGMSAACTGSLDNADLVTAASLLTCNGTRSGTSRALMRG